MHVSIRHEDKTSGLLRNVHKVAVVTQVEFSEEELAIINSRRLRPFVVLKRGPDAIVVNRFKNDAAYLNSLSGFDLTVANLVKGPDSYACETPVHAKRYEEELTEALKTLKSFLSGNAETAQATSFEL